MLVLLVIVGTFALCYAVDKVFPKLFRRAPQQQTGKSVRLSRRYLIAGILVTFFGILMAATAIGAEAKRAAYLLVAGILLVMGVGLLVYYATFGVYYDKESFLYSAFGKKSKTYTFGQITEQQLLMTRGGVCIELFFDDGRDTDLYANMEGVYDFMDTAFAGWCREKGVTAEDCPWYDPANSCWFPPHDPEAAEKAQNVTEYHMAETKDEKGTSYTVEPSEKE